MQKTKREFEKTRQKPRKEIKEIKEKEKGLKKKKPSQNHSIHDPINIKNI